MNWGLKMIINEQAINIDDINLNKTYINSKAIELKKSDILFYDGPESYPIYKARNRKPLANQLLVFCGVDEQSVTLVWGGP